MPSTVQAFAYSSTYTSETTTQSFVGSGFVVVVASEFGEVDVVVSAGGSVVTGEGEVVEDVVSSPPPPVQAAPTSANATTAIATFDMRRELTYPHRVLA